MELSPPATASRPQPQTAQQLSSGPLIVEVVSDLPLAGRSVLCLLRAFRPGWAVVESAPGSALDGLAAQAVQQVVVLVSDTSSREGWIGDEIAQRRAVGHPVVVIGPAGRRCADSSVCGTSIDLDWSADPVEVVAAVQWAARSNLASLRRTGAQRHQALGQVEDLLSERELDVLTLYTGGLKIESIGRRLGLSPHTVSTYLRRVRAKFARAGQPASTALDLYVAAVGLGVLAARPA
ncbi:MAG: LuxR family transcriptional regulator [Actinobacteria bacterium]|nr:MAG: LuxR family transcriptional regulator [Actinomycetota bacterium]